MRRAFLLIVLALTGCAASPDKMNRLTVGMSKSDVLQSMGKPYSTSAASGVEVLRYRLGPYAWNPDYTEEYFVKLNAGKVESYGKLGDFDSTKGPTLNVNINKP